MNIYLDIDGVLLINESNAAPHADDFIKTILKHFPNTTYWLTTHCWQGENRTHDVLFPYLRSETVELLKNIKPTEWGEHKTDAIDFSQPFLWLDDDLYPEEKATLQKHDALERWIGIDLQQNPNQLKELIDSANEHHDNQDRKELSKDDIKQVAKYFELLMEIDSKNKDRVANKNLSDNGYNCYNNNTMSSKKTAGNLFKKARQEKGLTQAQLAKKADIHPNTYAKIERDEQEASFSTVKRLAKVLDLNLSDIPD